MPHDCMSNQIVQQMNQLQQQSLLCVSSDLLCMHTHVLTNNTTMPSVGLKFQGRLFPTEKLAGLLPHFAAFRVTQHFSLFLSVVSCEKKNSQNLCSDFSRKQCFIKRLMFFDSFMSVLLFCLCSGKIFLCIIISEMSEVSF